MAEAQPEMADTVFQVASYLSTRLFPEHILFLDGGSCSENVAAASAGGATVLNQDRIFNAVDWGRLLPALNLTSRPMGRSGQGFNIFAGHIALAALGLSSADIVFQCDADICQIDELVPLERLLVAHLRDPDVKHAKLAQPGRNNEMIMAARSMQQLWYKLNLPWIPDDVKNLGNTIFMGLAPDKWMTCGLYTASGEIALSRPFASGYLDATTQALWSVAAPQCGMHSVRHVECNQRCLDAENTDTKEMLILNSVSLFIQSIVMQGIAPHLWDRESIAHINRTIMPELGNIPIIGDREGPVSIKAIAQDRLIPSVNQLCQAGVVNLDNVKHIVDAGNHTQATL